MWYLYEDMSHKYLFLQSEIKTVRKMFRSCETQLILRLYRHKRLVFSSFVKIVCPAVVLG
jgi:hypothetical protein